MINLFKYTAAFTLVFALFALNGAEIFHHHDCFESAAAQDNSCQACIIHKSLQSLSSVESSPDFTPDFSFTNIFCSSSEVPVNNYFCFNTGRAPPIA